MDLLFGLPALLAAGFACGTGLVTVHRHRDIWPHFGSRDTRCARLDSVVYGILSFSAGAAFLQFFLHSWEIVELAAAKPSALLSGALGAYIERGLKIGSLTLWGFTHLVIDRVLTFPGIRDFLHNTSLWRRP